MKRRNLLKSLSGSVVLGAIDLVDEPIEDETAGRWQPTRENRGGTHQPESLREITDRMDPTHSPRKLYGNGPPEIDSSRPRIITDCPSDQNCVSAKAAATYEGKTPYVKHPKPSLKNAYDLGMVNRDKKGVDGTTFTEKGVAESHRWHGEESTRNGRPGDGHRSLGAVVDRHRDGIWHRCLWQNTKLNAPPLKNQHNKARARAFGELFADAGYDYVGLCELNNPNILEWILDGYNQEYKQGETTGKWAFDPEAPGAMQDLGGMLYDGSGKRSLCDYDDGQFSSNTGVNKEGWQRFSIKVNFENNDSGVFEVFNTHLQPYNRPATRRRRKETLKELTEIISSRPDNRPKILVGDLNIHSSTSQYYVPENTREIFNTYSEQSKDVNSAPIPNSAKNMYNAYSSYLDNAPISEKVKESVKRGQKKAENIVDKQWNDYDFLQSRMEEIDMNDAWLTHGGPAGRTHGNDTHCNPLTGEDEPHGPLCHCDDFKGSIPGDRIDYVFVEAPKPDHELSLDISRMWRVPWNRKCESLKNAAGLEKNEYLEQKKMTDHFGVGFDLLTAPMT